MKPTVGRIVHYTNLGDADGKYPPEQQAAIITNPDYKCEQREVVSRVRGMRRGPVDRPQRTRSA